MFCYPPPFIDTSAFSASLLAVMQRDPLLAHDILNHQVRLVFVAGCVFCPGIRTGSATLVPL